MHQHNTNVHNCLNHREAEVRRKTEELRRKEEMLVREQQQLALNKRDFTQTADEREAKIVKDREALEQLRAQLETRVRHRK